jgi:hypothetical protein
MEYFEFVDHLSRQTSLDHLPIGTTLVLDQPHQGIRKSIYYKYNYSYFKSPTFKEPFKSTWGQLEGGQDAWAHWESGWRKVTRFIHNEQKQQQQQQLTAKSL